MNNFQSTCKVVLISQFPIPYSKIGSWTTLYKNYLQNDHKIDAIVCSKPLVPFEGVKYSFVKVNFLHKLQRKFFGKKKAEYIQALDKLICQDQKYIIQLIDNYGMVKPLKNYLISKGIDKQCYIQFFYHGFPPYIQKDAQRDFYEVIDELVLLTNNSYQKHREEIRILPTNCSILYNGIDTEKFTKLTNIEKSKLKKSLGFGDKKVFVWCSQDKPKKGLDLILEVWKRIYRTNKNIILLVIGCDPRERTDGVEFLGKIPNDELPKYYQVSDCYLFPTLYEEGFGLSLIEALHCGAHCIASAMGGVSEVLQNGKFGSLIKDPHNISEWEQEINNFLNGKFLDTGLPPDLYSTKAWNVGMNKIIEEAKKRLNY
ncbi:glycosyltransferase family 4 protein [Flavobacterium branchiicola]|uniref:Glycosyltransferase family 4 protein n=1 Tax=Flavobacterium branchiicola TaxID=1114875 RepID=A0ABV9PHZ9_9FLAO|nr:glycosyltransferase family 4 protein [Flavobacterium branchiicola]MBS7255483.1 glycosyltransferase family 4 protein [Flavobacterium branchiicola]